MADSARSTDDVGTNAQTTRSVLLKRNPHLRDQTSSPAGFGGLGTRQFLQKQLMTPGSATSASSFEEGASYDGFSDAGTPASEDAATKTEGSNQSLFVKAGPDTTQYVTRTVAKQPTKRLSSPSRESLARRLMGTSTKMHGMLPDEESASKVDMMEGDGADLPPSELLSNMVVKTVPSINVETEASSMTMMPLSPRSSKVTRRIVASPRKTMRRVVVRRTGADGKVHEEVQYLDAADQVVQTQGGEFFNAEGGETEETSTMSSGRTTVTRRISTPAKTVRRVVVRRTGADGQVHEEVQFVDEDGNVVEGDAATTSSTTSSTITTPSRSTVTRRIVTPARLTRRILRRTGADGQVHEEMQYLDADGNVVQTEGGDASSSSISAGSTMVTRRTVTPGKAIRRVIVRRTGADGQVHEEVQYMDADGNVVQSDGSELIKTSSFTSVSGSDAPGSSSGRTSVTRRVITPGQKLKRVVIRRRGADGEMHEEVQYVDGDGNVVPTEGSDLAKSGSFTTEETITHEGSSETPGRRKVTRRVTRRMLVRKDGTRVPVEQYVDSDGQINESEGGSLVSAGSFTGSVSSITSDTSTGGPSRRTITRRVVSSPGKVVRRTVVHKAGSSSGADSEDEVQYGDAEGGDLASSGSFTRTVTSHSTPGRRIITRRVVTPQRVVRRMVVRKGTATSGTEGDVDELDINAEFVHSEGSASSDESIGGSSRGGSTRGGISVSDRIIIPRSETRRVVSRTVTSSNQPQEETERVDSEINAFPVEKVVTSVTTSNQTEVTTPTRIGTAVVTEPHEGATSPEATQKIGLTPGVIWDYFTKSKDEAKPTIKPEESPEAVAPLEEEDKAPIPTSAVVTSTSTSSKVVSNLATEDDNKQDEAPKIGAAVLGATVAGAAPVTPSIDGDDNSTGEEMLVASPEEGKFTVSSVDEPIKTTDKTEVTPAKQDEKPTEASAGGFWGFFGKSEDNQKDGPSSDDEEPSKPVEMTGNASESNVIAEPVESEDQNVPDDEEDEFKTPEAVYDVGHVPESDEDTTTEITDKTDVLLPASAGVVAGAVVVTAATQNIGSPEHEREVNVPVSVAAVPTEVLEISTKPKPGTHTTEKSPRYTRRSSGGGFWGFFGKLEEEPKGSSDNEEDARAVTTASSPRVEMTQTREESVQDLQQQHPRDDDNQTNEDDGNVTAAVSTAEKGIASTSYVADVSDVEASASRDEEASKSPRGNAVMPAVIGATASIIAAAAVVKNEEPQKTTSGEIDHDVVAAPTAANVVILTTTKTEKVEEETSGGLWGFFGKSEHKHPTPQIEAQEASTPAATSGAAAEEVEKAEDNVQAVADVLTTPTTVIMSTAVVDEAQQELPTSHDGQVDSPDATTFHQTSVSDNSVEDKAPIPTSQFVQADIVDIPEPQVSPNSGAKFAQDEAAASPAASLPAVVTTQTTTVTTEKSESPSKVPHRKTGRSIWKFWGGDKPKSPLSEDDKEDSSNAVPAASTVVTKEQEPTSEPSHHTPVPSGGEAREFWHHQDKQNPPQISNAAKEAATYGPEFKFEPMPVTDKTRSPVARGQGAVGESPTNKESSEPNSATWAGGVMVTEVTTTTVEVEEEYDSKHLHRAAVVDPAVEAATVADIAVVTDSQQPIERESIEREEPKPARGGFWGFLGKKETPEKPAAAVATVESFDNSAVERVSWEIEGDEGKLPPDSTKHSQVTGSVAAAVHIESVRRSIPSDGTPKNVAAPVASSGKPIRDSERRTTVLIDGGEPDIELDEHYVEIASPRHGAGRIEEDEWVVKPCSLAWNKLRLNRKNWSFVGATPSGANEIVLNDVSGSVKAGEFLVITGPSKDESLALLSCLAGYEDAMEGNVTVNGREWNEKMNRYIAYVMREDLFYETLTVQEHLVIQAQLRMRRTHTDEQCLERVERVIEDMGLASCRDKLIGGGISLRGITRGERKLLALATALLINPSILLVEEPTDGLDTFSAERIVTKLRWLAFEKGLTVAVTLHHPSSHFYGLFDILYLVADASCVYDGKAADCVAYFSTIGYQCPEYMSPLDYFMLQMVVGDRESDDEGVARVEMLKREWSERNDAVYAENAARAAAASEDAVVDDYDQKNRYYHMGCCGQLWLLWARHVRRLSRYGFVFWWHLLAALLIGVVFGLVYLQLDLNDQKGIQNFAGAFFYIVVVQMLFMAYRTFVFMPRETAIALRERQEYRGGWYHLLCWYFTKIVAELPALIILSIVLFVPVFLLVGIGHGFKVYVYMQVAIVLAGWAAIGLGFLALGVLRHVTLALIVYAVLLALFAAFGGLLINVTDIPDWLVWLHYISPIKYGYEALMKIFWKRVDSIDCDWTLEGCVALTGEGVLKYYSMENRSALGDSLILLAICFAFFFFAFWFLLALANKRVSGLQWCYDWAFKGALGRRHQRVGNATVSEKHAETRSSMQRVIERKSQHSSSAAVERSTTADGENYYIRVETPLVEGHGLCDAPGITLRWSSLWLKAESDKKTKMDGETQQQQYLLSDASGSAKCGELVLITGPSNESNVALLESLGGLQKRVKGKVTLNGVLSAPQKLTERTAYVARGDLFYETLTVEEHLRFQAQLIVGKSSGGCGLCCGADASDLEAERVEMVLDELELTSKRHVLIRYLSAADTKLLAIATALLVKPSILLVEEPTCGMDFYSSQRVVLKLRQLAREGRTVVVTMTHPSSHLFALVDTLYLLAGGAAVYHGKVKEAVPYFASLGYQCPQYMSPVDYFVRLVSVRNNGNETADAQAILFKEAWSTRYSELCLAGDGDEPEGQASAAGKRHRVGCCSQVSLLLHRHILRLVRYRAVFGWHTFWMIILGVVFGLIFLQLDLDDQQDIQNWAGAFFFIIVLQMLMIAYRTFLFLPREMAIAEREHRSGGYYMICWYLTKMFAELPAMLVLSILVFVPAYLLIGIGHDFKLYFYMQLMMWLAGLSAAGMVTLLMGLFRRVRVALIMYMLLLILFVVFGGLLINVDDVPDYLIWLHYISPVKYGYEALMKLFWGRIAFLACGGGDGSGSGSAPFATVGDDYSFSMFGSGSFEDDDCIAHSGDEVLEHYSMKKSRDASSDSIILLELTILYFFIGYAFLSLRWRRYKTRQQRYQAQS
ncbi:unnamed protein product [Phytophthora lilii]|uniref:Unnamed protein product n=1 Tax=Phytophthora lilii TaxID=2077276 RepID=A0A9W6TYG1_9STRA|nr:unnamed protein product [Phytophthora lilii]